MFIKINRWILLVVLLAAGLAVPAGRPALAMHEEGHLHVSIDIRPGVFPNTIHMNGKEKLPVALFGSTELDVLTVDLSTVLLGPMDQHEVGAPVIKSVFRDFNGDGFLDVRLVFNPLDTGLTPADTEACLHGMTTEGVMFCGHDSVVVIG